jgi:uncharacterized protein YgbK (DUF1537 family)
MSLTIVADDLTGACDTGTLFAGKGAVPVSVWPRLPVEAPVRVVDTESRRRPAAEAAERVHDAACAVVGARYFKKIDSTLRGRIGAELEALMRAIGARTAVVCPALPAQGRVVVEGVLRIDGVPVARTPLARDPEFPRAAGDPSSVVALLAPQLDRPLAWVSLAEVRAGAPALAARLDRGPGTVVVADAERDDDLAAIVEAGLGLGAPPLLVGAAGLARALAARLALLAETTSLPGGSRWLVVAGSRHPATRRQIAAARRAGMEVLSTPEADDPDPARAAARLAGEARCVLERRPFDVVAVAGGETAVALYTALDAERIDLVGAPAPGLAFGYLRSPRHPALPVLTKAGGFGGPDLFVSLRREAAA